METGAILSWTLVSECPIPADVQHLLTQGEQPVAAYRTFRDVAIFTSKRLIVRDAQGMSGQEGRDLLAALLTNRHVVVRDRGQPRLELRA